MASEYLLKKYKDVKPDEKVELTPEQKRKNWWDYHKWHVVIGAVVLLLAADLVWSIMGRGQPVPDLQIAYVGTWSLPDDTVAAIEEGFAGLGEDLNGDGQVLVSVRQYVSNPDGDPSALAAVSVQIMADVMEYESFLFLLEDPESFQLNYLVLSHLDGTLPEDGDYSVENSVLLWKDCPVLAGLELGEYTNDLLGAVFTGRNQDLLAPLYIARRGFWTDQDAEYQEGRTALWERAIEGAVS